MDDYIYPVEIDYNRQILNDIINRIKIWPLYSPDNGKTVLEHKDILFPANLEAYRIKSLILESTVFSFSWVPPKKETGYHTDANRGCTLILPIDFEPHLIKFNIDSKEVDYYYSGPVITNAKTIHNGINHLNKDRFNLLFHFDKSYNHIVNLAKNNKLISNWIQSYPIKTNINNDEIRSYFNFSEDSNYIIENYNNEITINDKQKIIYKTASNFDLCQAIKYMIENPNVKTIEIE